MSVNPPSEEAVRRRVTAWRDYYLAIGVLLPADAEQFVALESARYRAMEREDFTSNSKLDKPPRDFRAAGNDQSCAQRRA